MIKNRLIAISTVLGVSVLSVVGTNQQAQAAIIVPGCTRTFANGTGGLQASIYRNNTTGICSPTAAGLTNQLFAWEGRAGARGAADYEFALGDNGAQANDDGSQPEVIYRDWTAADNDAALLWTLTYTGGVATFTIDGSPISYTSTATPNSPFQIFSLAAKVLGPDSKIDPGTVAQIVADRVFSGTKVVPTGLGQLNTALAAANDGSFNPFTELLLSTNTGNPITRVEGRLVLSWTGRNPNVTAARGRVGFVFKAFDLSGSTPLPVPPVSTPEPSAILGLGSLAALALGAGLKRKQARK